MRNLKLVASPSVAVALLAILKVAITGAFSLPAIGDALLNALPEMIVLPFLVYLLAPDPRRLPDSTEAPQQLLPPK